MFGGPLRGFTARPKRASARRQGQLAHGAGQAFEELLHKLYFAPLLSAGVLLHVTRIHPEATVVRRDAKGQALCIFSAAAAADWVALTSGGRYVAMEAKSCAGARLARSELKPQQEKHLDAAAAAGLAFLLVQFRDEPSAVYAVPWPAPWVRLRTAESIGVDALGAFRVDHWRTLAPRLAP